MTKKSESSHHCIMGNIMARKPNVSDKGASAPDRSVASPRPSEETSIEYEAPALEGTTPPRVSSKFQIVLVLSLPLEWRLASGRATHWHTTGIPCTENRGVRLPLSCTLHTNGL